MATHSFKISLRLLGNFFVNQSRRHAVTFTLDTPKRSVIDDDDDVITRHADLCICLGTSLQIFPCANLPVLTKKSGGRIAIVNLQVTRLDSRADLVVHERVDRVMKKVIQFDAVICCYLILT